MGFGKIFGKIKKPKFSFSPGHGMGGGGFFWGPNHPPKRAFLDLKPPDFLEIIFP